jgi:ClpP class serine protease
MILEAFGTPWLITETAFKTLIAIASRDAFFSDFRRQALEARDGAPLKNAHAATTRGSVAVIPVVGPLIRHADMFAEISGATSYASLRKDLQAALDSASVSSILFTIDSPGGEANGCFELADAIYAARAVKPVRAYVGGMGASAAYALACACEDITCAASSELGSIGVRAGFLDASRAMDAAGLKEWTFVSSQSPHKSFDVNVEDDRGRLQVVLDDLAAVFVGQVARNRDVGVDVVLEKFGKGDVMVGARAVAAGLADKLGDFESVLAEMDNMTGQPEVIRLSAQENRMTTKAAATSAPAPTASMQTSKCDGCGTPMSGNSYCQSCFDDDEDEDDEEDAKALGLDVKASAADRRTRMVALVDFEKYVLEAVGAKATAEARGKLGTVISDAAALPGVKGELAGALATGLTRDLRTTLEAGLAAKTLSLGRIQKAIPIVLRGEQKKAWTEAMAKLEEVKPETVLNAACSVKLSADDVAAIQEFAKGADPIAAAAFEEPPRDAEGESAELDETAKIIKDAAAAARRTLDRGMKAAPTK